MSEPTRRSASLPGPARGEDSFGPWRRVRELGRGAMGVVYEVEHEQTGERRALKLLLAAAREEVADEDLERFRREAELASRLAHPNLVRVHAWRLDPWPPWLVLDLLPGGSLKERLDRFPLPPEEARRIAIALADGLAHAHAHGVLHRDLKPANVMFDEEGRPRLADFGLARGLHAGEHGLTRTGEMLGTPVYMSPEQALDSKRLDERSDVYGLGGILYAMLTGQPPVQGVSTLVEAVEAVVSRAPLAPSRQVKGIPPGLEEVCLRALAKSPEDRYPSALAFRDALAALAPARATATSPGGRRPAAPLLALALLLLAAGVAAWILLGGRRADSPPPAGPGGAALAPTAPAPVPPPVATAEVAARAWTPLVGQRFHFVHTHGWRPPPGQEQAWLSLVLAVRVGAGPALEVSLLRARCASQGAGGAWAVWDTNPGARGTALAPRAILDLRGVPLAVSFQGGVACAGAGAWSRALSGLAVPAPAAALWAGRYEPAGLHLTWSAWKRLELSTPDERPRPGVATRQADGLPLWATWTDERGGWEALARVEVEPARETQPIDTLAAQPGLEERGREVYRVYLGALNAVRLFRWPAAQGEALLRPVPGLLPGVPRFDRAPATLEDLREPEQVRGARSTLAHAWPWGPPLAPLPAPARYLRLGTHGEWTRLAWGGGVAYALSQDLAPANGALGYTSTDSGPAKVFEDAGADAEIGRVEHHAIWPLLEELGGERARARMWFDERSAQVPGWYEPRDGRGPYMLWRPLPQ